MRADKFFAEKFGSRTKAANAIDKGLVLINGNKISPAYEVKERDEIQLITPGESFVSAGGYKLGKALRDFDFSVKNMVFADVGASTGGFTDCLLQNGAKRVYCIDVGESQLDKSLLSERTIVIDNFNARNLNREMFAEKLDGVVIDVSFISLTYILGAVSAAVDDGAYVLALIKPQFECEGKRVGKNGIVKDAATHKKVILKIYNYARELCLTPCKITDAPQIVGKNKEYIILLQKNKGTPLDENSLFMSVKL